VAALIERELGAAVALEEGARGEFSVWVGEALVARKQDGGFPEDTDVVSAVGTALARR
jgi:predicted Rdx family selenoprotein